MKLNDVQDMVEEMLKKDPSTRNSDIELYVKICESINPIACHMEFASTLRNRKAFGFPNLESVGRARRKLQAENEDLRAVKPVDDARFERFKEFRDYANQ